MVRRECQRVDERRGPQTRQHVSAGVQTSGPTLPPSPCTRASRYAQEGLAARTCQISARLGGAGGRALCLALARIRRGNHAEVSRKCPCRCSALHWKPASPPSPLPPLALSLSRSLALSISHLHLPLQPHSDESPTDLHRLSPPSPSVSRPWGWHHRFLSGARATPNQVKSSQERECECECGWTWS